MKDLIRKILKETEEFDWAKEIIDRDIILKIENLRIGDIVIPTCTIQEEFIVVHAGFKPEDIFSEKKHFEALLKRNTTKNTGGIYLSTENEFGRNCQFKLIDRPSLNEDKEEEFDWIEDVRQFTPAEEFLYDLMSGLKMVESKKIENWVYYKDENGENLMADDINRGTKNPSLYVDYYQIWEKLRGYGLNSEETKALCVRMLEATHKRKVLTAIRKVFI